MSDNKEEEEEKVEAGEKIKELPMKDGHLDFSSVHSCCTDCYCLIIFAACIIALIILFGVGFTQGNPLNIIDPTNSFGYFCSRNNETLNSTYSLYTLASTTNVDYRTASNDFTDYPVVVRVSLSGKFDTPGGNLSFLDVCIDECHDQPFCVNITSGETNVLEDGSSCAEGLYTVNYTTTNIAWRCLPIDFSSLTDPPDFLKPLIESAGTFISTFLNDLSNSWYVFLLAVVFALVFSFIFVCCYQLLAYCIVWMVIWISLIALFIVGLLVFIYGFKHYKDDLVTEKTSSYVFMGLGAALLLADLILFLIVFGLRKRISLATRLIQESSIAIRNMCCLIFVPIFYVIFAVAAFILLAIVVVFYFSTDVTLDEKGSRTIIIEKRSIAVFVFVFFFVLWTIFFIIGMNQTTIAGSGAVWYFTKDKKQLPTFPIAKALKILVFHHLGSIAVGSFLIAVIAFIRAVVLYLQKKYKERTKDNKVWKFVFCCVKCCLACLQRILEFISKRAYIMMMIYGKGFFRSAFSAMKLMLRNFLRTAILTGLTRLIVVLTIIAVTAISGGICIIIMRPDFIGADLRSITVQYWYFFAIICFILAFAVAYIIMVVYDSLIDTIFLCFLVDEEVCESKASEGYVPYASPALSYYMSGIETVSRMQREEEKRRRAEEEAAQKAMEDCLKDPGSAPSSASTSAAPANTEMTAI